MIQINKKPLPVQGMRKLLGRALGICLLLTTIALPGYSQQVAVKTNGLYWATATPNAGIEFAVNRQTSLEAFVGNQPWKLGEGSLRHWMAQAEFRYWPCRVFEGHFTGIHVLYGAYNVGNLSFIPSTKDYTYQGNMYGAGISYGYHYYPGGRWGLEFTLGAGYVHLNYDKYRCVGCNERMGNKSKGYFGPTRVGISLVYFLR